MSARILPFGVYRLSHLQKLMLQATLLKGEFAMQAWDHWQSSVDIEDLDASSNVLLPQLYQNLLIHDIQHPYIARLKGIYRRNWYANQLHLKYLKTLLSHLKDRGLEVIVLGKASFCFQVENYRSIDSFHLLVRSRELESAVQQLRGLNWQTTKPITKPFIHMQDNRQYSLYLQGHLFWAIPQDDTDDRVWQYATPDWGDRAGWQLSVTDQFLDGCARTFFKNRSHQIYGIADAMTLIQKSSNDLDWMRLITQAQRYQMILPVRNMLILLQEVLQFSAPSWVLPALSQMPIAQTEWLNYQVLAGDKRSLLRSTVAQSIRPLNYLQTQLLQLRHRPFPGRQVLKSLLTSTKSAP